MTSHYAGDNDNEDNGDDDGTTISILRLERSDGKEQKGGRER